MLYLEVSLEENAVEFELALVDDEIVHFDLGTFGLAGQNTSVMKIVVLEEYGSKS